MLKSALLVLCGSIVLSASAAMAQNLDDQSRALAVIRQTAKELCPPVDQTARVSTDDAKAKVEATLPGLVRELVNLGASGSVTHGVVQTQGVLQQQLVQIINSNYQCRLEVLKILQDKMLSSPKPRLVPGKPIVPAQRHLNEPSSDAPSSRGGSHRMRAHPDNFRQRPKPFAKTGLTLRLFFKDNLTSRDMLQLARLLPQFSVIPGGKNAVDSTAPADTLFVNRDLVERDEVLQVLESLSKIGIPIKAVIQSHIGGRREIQVGTITFTNVDGSRKPAFAENVPLDIKQLRQLHGGDFWRTAWNGAGICSGQLNSATSCSLDGDAKPVMPAQ